MVNALLITGASDSLVKSQAMPIKRTRQSPIVGGNMIDPSTWVGLLLAGSGDLDKESFMEVTGTAGWTPLTASGNNK